MQDGACKDLHPYSNPYEQDQEWLEITIKSGINAKTELKENWQIWKSICFFCLKRIKIKIYCFPFYKIFDFSYKSWVLFLNWILWITLPMWIVQFLVASFSSFHGIFIDNIIAQFRILLIISKYSFKKALRLCCYDISYILFWNNIRMR